MRSGLLRHRVTIQKSTPAQDAHGEPIDSWAGLTPNATVWGSVSSRPLGQRFVSGAEQQLSTMSHTVTIRYRADVTVKMRVLYGARTFYIENIIDPDGRKTVLNLMCREEQI